MTKSTSKKADTTSAKKRAEKALAKAEKAVRAARAAVESSKKKHRKAAAALASQLDGLRADHEATIRARLTSVAEQTEPDSIPDLTPPLPSAPVANTDPDSVPDLTPPLPTPTS